MKWKATYESEADVPAELKQFYQLKDGKWVFNYSEFDGLAELSNPTLNATKEDILNNKKKAETERDEWKKKADEAEKKLLEVAKPGTLTISKDDLALFEEYKNLGTPKDVRIKLENEKALSEKTAKYETEKSLRVLAQQTGTDPDALVEFKLNTVHGADINFGKEKRKIKSGSKEVEKEVLVVVHTDNVNGEKKTRTELFSDYAKEKGIPKFLVDAVFTTAVVESVGNKKKEVHLPITSGQSKEKEGEEGSTGFSAKDVVKRNNDSRNTRNLPWIKTPEKTKE